MDDTEILLATLISLLEPNVPEHAVLLNALVDCNGDVEAAAHQLQNSNKTESERPTETKKRKRVASALDSWLSPRAGSSSGSSSEQRCTKRRAASNEPRTTKLDLPEDNMSPSKDSRLRMEESQKETNTLQKPVKPQSTSSTNATTKPIDLMSVLRPPSPEKRAVIRNPPLTLSNPAMVAKHSPCTLHYSILPPRLACDLFYTMLHAAQGWSRNKWWLFDRLVESPHRTSFFARLEGFDIEGDPGETWKEAAQFWYNGRKTDPPHPFPEEMEEACKYVEMVVNEELKKRDRFSLEWGGSSGKDAYMWRANVAASNCYEGAKESVGFHSDQLTYLGPYPTIASLSLGTTRIFRLREVIPSSKSNERQAQTFNIPLPHNSLIIMHASTQERFKHCVPPQPAIDIFHPQFPRQSVPGSSSSAPSNDYPNSNCRINITFRFYRPDFVPSTIPRCMCGLPCVLRPDMKGRLDERDPTTKSLKPEGVDPKRRGCKNLPSNDAKHHIRYWWNCYAGAQNEGKGCGMWKVMDVKAEGRGPFVGDRKSHMDEGQCQVG